MRSIRQLDDTVLAGRKIIPHAEIQRFESAHDVIAEAETWAQAHRDRAIAEMAEEASAAAQAATADGMAAFGKAVSKLRQTEQALELKLQDALGKCLSKVLHSMPPVEVLAKAVGEVVSDIPAGQDILFCVNPSQAEAMERLVASLNEVGSCARFEVRPDASLPETSCRIFSERDAFNIDVASLVETLVAAFSGVAEEVEHDQE